MCTIKLSKPADFTDLAFHLGGIEILNDIQTMYYSCTNPEYNSEVQCTNAGESWRSISDEFFYTDLCYIKSHPTKEDPDTQELKELFDGEYQWSTGYCWPWQGVYAP